MLLGFITDGHGNIVGTRTVKAELEKLGVDGYVFLGDNIGYYPDPGACLDVIREVEADGKLIASVAGNHEQHVAQILDDTLNRSMLNDHALMSLDWTAENLSSDDQAYVRQLVRNGSRTIWGGEISSDLEKLSFSHSNPFVPEDMVYLNDVPSWEAYCLQAPEVPTTRNFTGHTHVPLFAANFKQQHGGRFYLKNFQKDEYDKLSEFGKVLICVPSAGQPRDGIAKVGGLTYNTETDEIHFLRLDCDHTQVMQKMAGIKEYEGEAGDRIRNFLKYGCSFKPQPPPKLPI